MSNIYRFGDFEFSTRTLELGREGRVVPLAPQPARVLELFLANPGTLLLRDEIQDRIWPDETSRVTREQGLNACIRQIREALGEEASSPTYIETRPRRGYRFVAPVEVGEERRGPIARPSGGSRPGPGSRRWVPRLTPWAAAALLGLLALAGVGRLASHPAGSATEEDGTRARLAVLPFENLSDARHRAFALGLTEEVTTRLASLDPARLDIIAHASSRRSRAAADGAVRAGRSVRADYVLDGSVRAEGDRFRVSAQLVRVSDGAHLWAEQFEGKFGHLLDLHEELGSRISAAILPSLSSVEPPTRSRGPEEPDLAARLPYLEGLHLLGRETREGAREAVGRLEEAVRLDPDFALGHATLAEALFWSGQRDRAERSARRALALDEALPEAHMVLAEVLLDRDFAFSRADEHFRRAIELAPRRPRFHQAYAHYLTVVGRHEEALDRLEIALDLNPLAPALTGDAGWHLYWAGRFGEAAERCTRLARLTQGVVRARGERCALQSLARLGRLEEARAHALAIMELGEADDAAVERVAEAPAREALSAYTVWSLRPENRALALGGDSPYTVARALADLGERDRALASLEEALRVRPRGLLTLAVEPRFARLRDDARFERLVRSLDVPGTRAPSS